MNIKEAYRYQTFLNDTINTLEAFISRKDNVMTTIEKSFKSKVNKEAIDEEVDKTPERIFILSAVDAVYLIEKLIEEKSKLAHTLQRVKEKTVIIVGEAYLNLESGIEYAKKMRDLAHVVLALINLKPTVTKSSGYDYKFNVEGNQLKYLFETEITTSLDYDKSILKTKYQKLMETADKVSLKIEEEMTRDTVYFTTIYSIYDSVESIVENYIASRG